jgi:hypothetical protein
VSDGRAGRRDRPLGDRRRRPVALAFVSLRLLLTAGALGSVLVVGSPAGQACASGAPHAALVIATGDRTLRYCVALDGNSVSAIHVIELAHAQDGLEYRLGFGGQAVCELDGVGTASGDCFSDYPNFWGFWLGGGSGGWSWSGSGAASTPMHDGDVEGWSWGSGSSGATHSPPPETTLASVCGTTPPPPTPTASPPHGSTPPVATPAATGANAMPGDAGDTGGVSSRSVRPSRVVVTPVAATTSGGPLVAAAAAPPAGGGGGPPPGAIVAIAAAGILGLAGWWRVRGGASSGSKARGRR